MALSAPTNATQFRIGASGKKGDSTVLGLSGTRLCTCFWPALVALGFSKLAWEDARRSILPCKLSKPALVFGEVRQLHHNLCSRAEPFLWCRQIAG